MKRNWIVLMVILTAFQTYSGKSQKNSIKGFEIASKMADSEMKQFPEPWTVDFNPKPAWNYTQGLIAHAMIKLWQVNGKDVYFNYAKTYADKMIDSYGHISAYDIEEYNIDCMNSGKFLFDVYEKTKDERYLKVINHLREQFKTHPRTSEGGFWHKKCYPNQMWLDGLYMGAPFFAQYAAFYNDSTIFDDVVNQFVLVHKHTYSPEMGLNYHGWDESKEQKWANSETGCSPSFWGRAMGWYSMALVDVLDFLPLNHPGRVQILAILNQVASGIKKYQDPETGLYYQVLDQGTHKGNYLEASVTSMFTYALLKASRKGYISNEYIVIAIKAYNGILTNLIQDNGDGTISLTKCCSVAGLGGKPYRNGTFEYYINEPTRDNDPKGVGPFIMASIEFSML